MNRDRKNGKNSPVYNSYSTTCPVWLVPLTVHLTVTIILSFHEMTQAADYLVSLTMCVSTQIPHTRGFVGFLACFSICEAHHCVFLIHCNIACIRPNTVCLSVCLSGTENYENETINIERFLRVLEGYFGS